MRKLSPKVVVRCPVVVPDAAGVILVHHIRDAAGRPWFDRFRGASQDVAQACQIEPRRTQRDKDRHGVNSRARFAANRRAPRKARLARVDRLRALLSSKWRAARWSVRVGRGVSSLRRG